jgi:hypothetical protein
MPSSDIRDSNDVLDFVARSLRAQGSPVDAGVEVDLEPLFRDIYLGGEINRVTQILEAAVVGDRLLRQVGQNGRRYTLTPAGAARAQHLGRRLLRRLSWPQRLVVATVIILLAVALYYVAASGG